MLEQLDKLHHEDDEKEEVAAERKPHPSRADDVLEDLEEYLFGERDDDYYDDVEEELPEWYDPIDEEDEDDEDSDDDGDTTPHEPEFLRLRAEVCHLLQGVPAGQQEFYILNLNRYDYLWFLILAYSLQGRHFDRVQRLRQMIQPRTPFYRQLKAVAAGLHRWGVQQRRANLVPEEEWQDWPEEENPGERPVVELSERVTDRLIIMYVFAVPFLEDRRRQIRYNDETLLVALLFASQYYDSERDEMTTDEDYTPPWYL